MERSRATPTRARVHYHVLTTFLVIVDKVAVPIAHEALNTEARLDCALVNAGGVGVAAVETNTLFTTCGLRGADARAVAAVAAVVP